MIDFESFSKSDRKYELHRADSSKVLQLLPDESVDAFVTDPPYGIELKLGTRRRGQRSIAGDGKLEAMKLWQNFLPHAARIAKPDTAHLFFGTWKSPWMHDLLARHFTVKGCIVWDKRMIGLGFYLRPRWELIFYCHKGKPPLPARAEADIWCQARLMRTLHPCQKPVELLRRGVLLCTSPGQIVADPFAGIGSTGIAALLERRRFFGVEIDGNFCQIGRSRLKAEL